MKPVRPIVKHPLDATLAIVTLTKGAHAVINIEDAEAVGKWNWCVGGTKKTAYAIHIDGFKGPTIYLHRFIAERAGMDVSNLIDHENRNGLDCRRENLRPATVAQNAMNAGRPFDSKSGIKGVSRNGTKGWRAGFGNAGAWVHLGTFATKEEAGAAVREARSKAHGEFANHGDDEGLH